MSANTLQPSPAEAVQDNAGVSGAFGVLVLVGPDAVGFLQGQVTQDLAALPADHWARAALCTAQGRVLALPKVMRRDDGLWLVLPQDRVEPIRAHLQRHVFRAKVKLVADGAIHVLMADGGGLAPAPGPYFPMRVDGEAISLDLSPGRRLVLLPTAATAAPPGLTWPQWLAACVADGEPEVFAPSAECWTPHMLGQDRWQAISLTKGCYTGQEIVARTHYLGKNKRHLESATLPPTAGLPSPGEALDLPDGRRGEWVLGVADAGRVDCLVVTTAPETARRGSAD